MKIIKIIGFLTLASPCAFSQAITVNGTVNNQKGEPVPYAFVRDANHNYATFADSTGTFRLKADPSSSLAIMANKYKDALLKIDNNASAKVILSAGEDNGSVASLKSDGNNGSAGFLQARQQLVAGNAVSAGGGSDVTIVRSGFAMEATRGSRYLYPDWIPGFGINKNDGLVVEITNMYNYDKVAGNIMYTNDGKSMAAVSIAQVKTFTLYEKGRPHVYENSPAVDDKKFVEVLLSTPKYKIYKKVDTKLSRADYHTDGVLEMGHRYDEYVDNDRYYFVGEDGKAKSISLKKNSLKKLLGTDADAFMAAQGSRDVDEQYVKDLGESIAK